MTIIFKHKGNFERTTKFLTSAQKLNVRNILELYAKQGVAALSKATPKDTGLTSTSWDYYISVTRVGYSVNWTNSNENNGVPVAILIQYGHVANGAFVQGRDFINPAIKPILDKIAQDLWKEVSAL